ncbi:MAG: hypothetical protein QOH78_929 [Verrucomicrobiota bacterium]
MLIRLINRSTALFGWTNFSHRPRVSVVAGGETVDLICPSASSIFDLSPNCQPPTQTSAQDYHGAFPTCSLSIPQTSAKAFRRCLRSVLFLPERHAFDQQRQKLENEHDHDHENDSGKRCSSA